MLQIVILCVAALFVGNCESADLQILIDGIERSASCTGENVTYVCNIPSGGHSWRINGSPPLAVTLAPQVIQERYTLQLVSTNDTLVSSLSVTSFDGLNGVDIMCVDPDIQNPLPPQEAVAMVLDPPSIPMLSVIVSNIESVNIIVTPPSVSPVCVLQYNISYSSSCDSEVTNITLDSNTTDPQPVQVTIDELNLCDCSYAFTVAADTKNGIGERSGPISRGSLSTVINDPNLNITTSDFYVTVSAKTPEVVNIVIKYTYTNGTNVSLDVMKMNDTAESETLLDCGFTNRTVDFFVEFTSQCGMKTITNTTSPLPPLILNMMLSASTINSIRLVLTTNKCMGKDRFSVSSCVIDDDNTVISQINTSLNGITSDLLHENMDLIADKDYICKVSIMDGGVILDSITIFCRTSSPSMSSDSSPPIIIIVIVIVVCCVVLMIVAMLVVIYLKKKGAGSGKKKEKSTPSYQEVGFISSTNGPDTTDTGATSKNNPPTYQDPSTIKHETAADGDVYTMVDKKPKKKKGKEEKDDVAAMYSMPDKSKKNPELMYADIQVSNPQHPPNNRGIGNRSVLQQDTSSVTYASVESPTTKF